MLSKQAGALSRRSAQTEDAAQKKLEHLTRQLSDREAAMDEQDKSLRDRIAETESAVRETLEALTHAARADVEDLTRRLDDRELAMGIQHKALNRQIAQAESAARQTLAEAGKRLDATRALQATIAETLSDPRVQRLLNERVLPR